MGALPGDSFSLGDRPAEWWHLPWVVGMCRFVASSISILVWKFSEYAFSYFSCFGCHFLPSGESLGVRWSDAPRC